MEQDYVRITHSKPENERTTVGRIACERLQAEIYSAIDTYHHVSQAGDGLLGIEVYPCGSDCEECEAA